MLFCPCIDNVKKLSLLIAMLMQPMLLQAQPADAFNAKLDDSTGPDIKKQQRNSPYPHWPAGRQINTVMVPPPPPGPYKSLALNDFSVNQASFSIDSMQATSKLAPADVPMEGFSPDVPWPENLRPVSHRMPENGYRYAPPPVINKPYPGTQNSPSNYRQGYRRSTNMNWPDSRWKPSMAADSRGPYSYTPAIRPGYSKTPNTAPYPSVGQP